MTTATNNGTDVNQVTNNANAEPVIHIDRSDARSLALNGLFVLAILYTLYIASALFVPITLALLLSLLFGPAVTRLEHWRIPTQLGALLVVATGVLVVGSIVYALSVPARDWFEKLPQTMYRVEQKLSVLKQPIEKIKQAGEQIEQATSLDSSNETKTHDTPQKVEIQRPGIIQSLFTGSMRTLASVGLVILLLYFLLAAGDTFLRKLVSVIPAFEDKKRAVEIFRSIKQDISFYLLSLSLVNVGIGLSLTAILYAIGIENPLLWGVLATLLSFAPYAGSFALIAVLTLVGMASFATWQAALVPPAAFFVLMVLAGNFIMPYVVGSRLTLSPLAIFIAIIFWGWLWGPVGALLAVPLLAAFKIICERIDKLAPVAEFLTP